MCVCVLYVKSNSFSFNVHGTEGVVILCLGSVLILILGRFKKNTSDFTPILSCDLDECKYFFCCMHAFNTNDQQHSLHASCFKRGRDTRGVWLGLNIWGVSTWSLRPVTFHIQWHWAGTDPTSKVTLSISTCNLFHSQRRCLYPGTFTPAPSLPDFSTCEWEGVAAFEGIGGVTIPPVLAPPGFVKGLSHTTNTSVLIRWLAGWFLKHRMLTDLVCILGFDPLC